MKVFFNIALFGGLRRGEIIALKWSDILKDHREEQEGYQLSLGSYWKGDDYLFTQQDGSQMDVDTPNHIFKKIINRYNERIINER